MNPARSIQALGLLSVALSASLHAETLVQYTFGTSGSTSNATTTGSNVTTSAFTRGAGLPAPTFSTAAGAPDPRSIFVTSAAVDDTSEIAAEGGNGDWLGFTLSAATGNTLNLSELSFYYAFTYTGTGTITGSATFDVRSSADNYASTVATYTPAVVNSTTPVWDFASIGLTAAQYQSLNTVTFRVYLKDGDIETSSAQLRLDTVTLSGVSSAIPEPSTYALLLGAGGLGFVLSRRPKRSL